MTTKIKIGPKKVFEFDILGLRRQREFELPEQSDLKGYRRRERSKQMRYR